MLDVVALLELRRRLALVLVPPRGEQDAPGTEDARPAAGGGLHRRLARRDLQLAEELGADVAAPAVAPHVRGAADARARSPVALVDAGAQRAGLEAVRRRGAAA